MAKPESAERGGRDGYREGGVGRAEPLEVHHQVLGFGHAHRLRPGQLAARGAAVRFRNGT